MSVFETVNNPEKKKKMSRKRLGDGETSALILTVLTVLVYRQDYTKLEELKQTEKA